MKKNFFYILAYTLLLGIGGCSDDDEPIVPKELKIFSMTPTEGVAGDEVTITGQGFSICHPRTSSRLMANGLQP